METNFTFSDTIAGYAIDFNSTERSFTLETSDKRVFKINLSDNCFARFAQNLNEGYQDATSNMFELLALPRQMVFAYGTFYPKGDAADLVFQAQWLVFPGKGPDIYRHEEPDWWINQIDSIAHTYLKWQFNYPQSSIDYKNYRTLISLDGYKKGDGWQETDTISRLIYGLASAYMLTGKDEFLEGAEKGTQYLRDYLRETDPKNNLVYWNHALNIINGKGTKVLPSQFNDDKGTIPLYEQIYALAGPTQTFRITGDPKIKSDIDKTITFFDKYYKDDAGEGYFSHVDPANFDPQAEMLGQNKAKKNWNSVGDHAPAYLINLYLATGDMRYAKFLEYTFDTITKHFQDYDHSPFVQERFFKDWSKDQTWGWQQNRAVVGHNLKIAWNLMRMYSLNPKPEYLAFAKKIAEIMPQAGSDRQRFGWYDVLEREKTVNGKYYDFVWHDRKAWWQQEQGILAYLILSGKLGDDVYRKYACESAAYYNAFFLDTDDGAVYFNTLSNGMPYLLGTERMKGSHSMSGYHSMELCFLSATYINLLITKQPLYLYFKPYPKGFENNILHVSPDILLSGSVFIEQCWVDDQPYTSFDANGLTVKLPDTDKQIRVKVKLSPKK